MFVTQGFVVVVSSVNPFLTTFYSCLSPNPVQRMPCHRTNEEYSVSLQELSSKALTPLSFYHSLSALSVSPTKSNGACSSPRLFNQNIHDLPLNNYLSSLHVSNNRRRALVLAVSRFSLNPPPKRVPHKTFKAPPATTLAEISSLCCSHRYSRGVHIP